MDAPPVPMRPTDARVDVASVEWLFSPDWPGQRLIARRGVDGVRLTDPAGQPVEDRDDLSRLLEQAIDAQETTVDGVWTEHPLLLDGASGSAFIAIDLLELDGEPILDVPFQERHRLLESVVAESLQVRVSPIVKQPIAGWLRGWRESGFTHYLAWHQNAPYRPGQRTDEWYRIPIALDQPGGGIVGRLVGVGPRRPRRIRD